MNKGRLVIDEGYTKEPPEVSFHVEMVYVVWKKCDRKMGEELYKDGDTGEKPKKSEHEAVPEAAGSLSTHQPYGVIKTGRDTSLVTAIVQTFAEINATPVVQKAVSEPKLAIYEDISTDEEEGEHQSWRRLAIDEDVSTDEEEGEVRMHFSMVYVISSKYSLPKSRVVCSVTKTQEEVNEVASKLEKVIVDSTVGSSENGPPEITDALQEWCMMFLRPSPAMMEHLRPLYVIADIDGMKVSKILVDAGATVCIMTVRTMTMLSIKKSSMIETTMTVKNFASGVTKPWEF
ncbi:hypothetical protein ACLB2K_019300 [Fragaria x ananassa]